MKKIANPDVARVFAAQPKRTRAKLFALRELIFETAAATPGVGELEETLKWGDPAYLTAQTGSGTTIRINGKKANDTQVAMYFHCQSGLVDSFRAVFPTELTYEGNRAIVFGVDEKIPERALGLCIAKALTHHLRKKNARQKRKDP